MTLQSPTPFPQRNQSDPIAFDRQELGLILGLYGRMVVAGQWRDYAISFLRDAAIFAVFRSTGSRNGRACGTGKGFTP
jgi:hypothetical protein